jgi:flagella basal body P-ring formation protein FlgA
MGMKYQMHIVCLMIGLGGLGGLAFAVPAQLRSGAAVATAESGLLSKGFEDSFVRSVRAQLAAKLGEPESEFRVEARSLRVQPALEPHRIRSVQVLGLGALASRRLEGLVTVPVFVRYETDRGEREMEYSVSGILQVVGPVYTTRANLPRGHVMQPEDLNVTALPWRGLASDALGLPRADIVGRRVKSLITAGTPVSSAQLDEPFAVKTGELVDLTVVAGPGVMIRSRALAKQEGRVGDLVRVEQPDTKKALSAVVTGPRTVEVRL